MQKSYSSMFSRRLAASLATAFWIGPFPVAAQDIIPVADAADLGRALSDAPERAILELAPGDYGSLNINGDIAAGELRSADPENPARFSGVRVRDVADLVFDGLMFDYTDNPEHEISIRHFTWERLRNVTIRNSTFDGDLSHGRGAPDDGYGMGFGLVMHGGDNILIENNEIYDFFKGMLVRDTRNLTVRGNEIHSVRSDGMNFVQVADVLVEGNHIHNLSRSRESEDHADMIQFWTARTDWPSHNVVIRGNLLNAGNGLFSQTIFMRNERADRAEVEDLSLFYRNITIEENVVINAHAHGIATGEVNGLVVARNTLIQNPDATPGSITNWQFIPRIRINSSSRNVRIEGNITARIDGFEDQQDWSVSDNLFLQNRSLVEPNHYSRLFAGFGPGMVRANVATYAILPGSVADREGLGAALLRDLQ